MPVRKYPCLVWVRAVNSSELPLLVVRETEDDWVGAEVEECFTPPVYMPRRTPILSYWPKKIWKAMSQEDAKGEFLRKIADGKLLMRYSRMTCNATCDACGSEEHIEYSPDFPDNLKHKSWCVVTAARTFFPAFVPSPHNKPRRSYGNQDTFDWFSSETKEEVAAS